jgi:hypothetical protein
MPPVGRANGFIGYRNLEKDSKARAGVICDKDASQQVDATGSNP